MSAPTPGPGDDRPREGYYPDPSIPGYVRYWNGAAWVPGTSRPAPRDGEPLIAPAAPAVEETGPHFFDEDPQPAAEPAAVWGADPERQSGFGGEQDRRVAWGTDPRVSADGPAPPEAGPGFGAGPGPGFGAGFGPGFGAGKAAARAAQPPAPAPAPSPAAPSPVPTPAPAPVLPQQSSPGSPGTPVSPGSGGGQSSWAQQVHQLAGGDQPVVPWKPPVEDPFLAAARRQSAARPANLGKRLAARLVDTLIVGAVTAAAAVPLGTKAADHIERKIDTAKRSGSTVTVWLLDGTTGAYLGIVVAVLLATGILYEVLPTARWGRTLGKRLCALEVRDIEAHEPPTFGAALRRWLVYAVPGLLGIGVAGVIWCLFDRPWRQCWHDKAAHTFVAG